jgi:hypothetical protein
MPQGRAKKIQFQLLLADFPLQFVNSPLRLRRIGDVQRRTRCLGLHRLCPRRAANTAKPSDPPV